MSKDGAGTPSLSERLIAKSAADLKALEDEIRRLHQQLVANLSASSQAALRQTEESIQIQLSEIEREVRASRDRMTFAIAEIEITPKRLIRKTMLWSAVTGGIVAMLPWAIMSWLGISVMQSNAEMVSLRMEERRMKAQISALGQIEVVRVRGQEVLMLPETAQTLMGCGPEMRPCIPLEK